MADNYCAAQPADRIDLLRRHWRPSPDELREIFREIILVSADDGIAFKAAQLHAGAADHDEDGYVDR